MSDPLSDEAEALISAANEATQPSLADQQRVRAALETQIAALAIVTMTTATVQGGTGKLGSSLAIKIVLGLTVTGALGAGALWVASRQKPSAPTARPTVRSAAQNVELVPEPEPTATPTVVTPSKRVLRHHAPLPVNRVPAVAPPTGSSVNAPPPPNCSLEVELRLIEHAQRELRAHQPGRALEIVAEHEEACPNGALNEERQATRIIAWCELGRMAEASQALAQLREQAPRSPQLGRIQAACRFEAP